MAHGDNNGLVLPPRLAPIHVVMVPVFKKPEEEEAVLAKMREFKELMERAGLTVKMLIYL